MDTAPALFPAEPLAAFRLFGTREVEVARAIVGRTFCPHRLEVPRAAAARFDTRHNHVAGQILSLNHLGYGSEVSIDPGRLEQFYLIQIPLAGRAQVANGHHEFGVGVDRGSVLNPTLPTRMVWHEGCRKLLVRIDRAALNELAQRVIGQRRATPVVFDPAIDLARPAIRVWLGHLARCVRAAEAGRAFGQSGYRFQRPIEEELLLSFVEAQPSSIRHYLEGPCVRPAGAGHVRRARDFVHDHIDEPFTVADLSRIAGCSLRSLQMAFTAALDMSPRHYVTRARLDLAHARLQTAGPEETVADIAHDAGFAHLGRFAAAYRQQFGQCPSATLRGASGRAA